MCVCVCVCGRVHVWHVSMYVFPEENKLISYSTSVTTKLKRANGALLRSWLHQLW